MPSFAATFLRSSCALNIQSATFLVVMLIIHSSWVRRDWKE